MPLKQTCRIPAAFLKQRNSKLHNLSGATSHTKFRSRRKRTQVATCEGLGNIQFLGRRLRTSFDPCNSGGQHVRSGTNHWHTGCPWVRMCRLRLPFCPGGWPMTCERPFWHRPLTSRSWVRNWRQPDLEPSETKQNGHRSCERQTRDSQRERLGSEQPHGEGAKQDFGIPTAGMPRCASETREAPRSNTNGFM